MAHAHLLTEEANDPGITQVYTDLMSTGGHGNTYSLRLPPASGSARSVTARTWFGRTFGATVLAVRDDDGLRSARPGTGRSGGTTLYYVATRRIDDQRMSISR